MTTHRYRLIDTAGSELFIVDLDPSEVEEDRPIRLPDGTEVPVIEIYDDEHGQDGNVSATLVVDID